MVLRLWFFWLQSQQDVFFSNWTTSSRIIASQSDMLTTTLSSVQLPYPNYTLRAPPPILRHLESSADFDSSQIIGCYIGIHVNQRACSVPGTHREPFPCAGLQLPSPWKAPFLLPQPWAPTEPVFCLFTLKATPLLIPSRGMSVF